MTRNAKRFKSAVAVAASVVLLAGPALSQDQDLTDLFNALRDADPAAAAAIEGRIIEEWSKTGSPSLDLLMRRAGEAMEAQEFPIAIEHLTALIDHAPELAHPYSMRANAYFLENKYGPALEDLQKALARNPQHFDALTGLAAILEELGLDQEALEINREIEALYPAREGLREALDRLERRVEGTAL